ncbi:hypothetical protein, partial [Citrobacter freundii]
TQPATGETYPKSDLFNKAPKQMNHHEKPDTIFSIDDDEKVEEIKIQLLKAKIQCAQCDIHSDNIVNGDNFFDELMEPNK